MYKYPVVVISVLYLASIAPVIQGTGTNNEASCNCHWEDWQAWSGCNNTCYGTRVRERSLWITQTPECIESSECVAAEEEMYDYETCNKVCSNGGTPGESSCNCVVGYTGRCCTFVINCGTLDSIPNGGVSYSNSTYGASATYWCNQGYSLRGGSTVRLCGAAAVWEGRKPYCSYVNHCSSHPCQNRAVCSNLYDDYRCTCAWGWSGEHCDMDAHPPLMTGCSADISVHAKNTTINVKWTEPRFTDPFGNELYLTKNYQSPSHNFPSGDFTVQYTATKRNNGLSRECVFNVKVRPTPCDELNVPVNGARICTGLETDYYGRFCMVACDRKYMIDPEENFDMVYVCGASGEWIGQKSAPDCDWPVSNVDDALVFHPEFMAYTYEGSCTEMETSQRLKERFISRLNGKTEGFSKFCTAFPNECIPDNVEVICY